MYFIKVNDQDISPLYSDAQVGALVRYGLLVARYGRIPERKELTKCINANCLVSLERIMTTLGVNLEYFGSKVLVDRERIESKRRVERERKAKLRTKNKEYDKCPAGQVESVPSQIREDKIRIDKIKEKSIKEKDAPTEKMVISEAHKAGIKIDIARGFYFWHSSKGWNSFKWDRGDKWQPSLRGWALKEKKYGDTITSAEKSTPYRTIDEMFKKDKEGNYVN